MFGNAIFRWRDAEQAPRNPASPGRRAALGLALGGGAARGWAHLGVLHALAEAGLVPDIVTGTSIGAVVGGCYAAGEIGSLEAFARGLTRRRVFGLLDLNLAGRGLISGNRISRLLEARLAHVRIEQLAQKFVAVATELGTGHEVWMSRGGLVDAMRASYALPGIFQPVRLNGRWLVDGTLVNPVPVSAARALGAEVVIAVNLQGDAFGRGTIVHDQAVAPEADAAATDPVPDGAQAPNRPRRHPTGRDEGPPGIPAVMLEAFNIIQDRITRSRLAGDPPDLVIGPRLGHIGSFEFHRATEAIDIGYQAARRATADIGSSLATVA